MRSIAPWLRPRSGAVAVRFCAFGLIAACDGSAAPPIPPPRPPPDAVDAAPHRDAVAGDVGGEVEPGDGVGTPCTATLECATGICRRGVCGPLCADDDACPAGFHCVPDAGGLGACVRTCDGAGACPFGLFCVADAPGRGACVAPGPLPAGAACRVPDDCAARTCVDGRCPSSCGPETGCPPGQACLPLHVGGVCVEAGAGAPEAPCRSGSECRSGVCRGGGCSEACDATVSPDPCPGDRRCVPYETLALCERPCVSAGDCGSHGLCLAEGDTVLCQSRGGGAAGDACERPADCRSGHCSGGRCDPECGAGCPPATACVRDVTGATCRPAGAQPENAPCSTGAECRSGFCAAGRCGRDCAEGPDCPAGMACIGFASGRFCFPRCQIDSDCEAPAYCADALGAEPVCFWRGAVSDGAACGQDFECRSGLCRGEICLPPCPDAVCPGGLECRDFGRGPFCTGVPAPLGAECSTAEACAAGLGCEAGRCLPPCIGGCPPEALCAPGGTSCVPACARDVDCRPGFVCQRHAGPQAFCAPRGASPDGAPCSGGLECRSGLCHGGRCRPECNGCTPGGGLAAGTPCAHDTACASGLCVAGVCTHPCPDVGCGAGRACVFVDAARVCLGLCEKGNLDCDAGLACAPEADGVLVCRGARAGGAAEGAPCTHDAECAVTNPVCRAGACHRLCDRDDDCGADRRCSEDRAGLRLCVARGRAPSMSPCDRDSACESGLCEGGRCFRACADDCGATGRCEDAARNPDAPDRRCVPACTPASPDCPEGTQCRAGADGLAGCY